MKKIVLIAAALCVLTAPVTAQGWKDAMKKAATTAADKATDGKLTQTALVGEWHYKSPGVKLESNNVAAEVGGAALEGTLTKKLEKAYLMAGIKPGACSFTFNADKTFSAAMGTHALSGTYEFEAPTHTITLHFAKGKLDLGSVPGHAYITGSDLSLVFPVTKLVDMVTKLGSNVSSLSSVATMLEKYKSAYLGFEFGK